jgi:hypothetical protein
MMIGQCHREAHGSGCVWGTYQKFGPRGRTFGRYPLRPLTRWPWPVIITQPAPRPGPAVEVEHGVELEDVDGPKDNNIGDRKNVRQTLPPSYRRHAAFLGLTSGEGMQTTSWRPRELHRKGGRRFLDNIDNMFFFSTNLQGICEFVPDWKAEAWGVGKWVAVEVSGEL